MSMFAKNNVYYMSLRRPFTLPQQPVHVALYVYITPLINYTVGIVCTSLYVHRCCVLYSTQAY